MHTLGFVRNDAAYELADSIADVTNARLGTGGGCEWPHRERCRMGKEVAR